jgi:hypothetical protein
MPFRGTVGGAIAIAVGIVTLAAQTPATRGEVRSANQKATASPADLDAYLAVLPRVGDYYLTEGDLLRTRDEIAENFEGLRATPTRASSKELTVNRTGDRDDIWPRGRRALTYSIDRRSFASRAESNQVLTDMKNAAAAWVRDCKGCGLTFTFREDPTPSTSEVTFVVRAFDLPGDYVATAPFPSWGRDRRYVNVDSIYFQIEQPFSGRGVMRHELGHVLGYRHEHLHGVPGCAEEDGQWRRVIDYSSTSVLHYLCGGGGSSTLDLDASDKAGHQKLYGG